AVTYPSSELARFGRELQAVRAEAAELLDGLSRAQLAWAPEPGRWSVGENVSHLRTLNTRYIEAIDEAIAAARARGHTGFERHKPGLIGGFMVRFMEPPVKRRVKTPAVFVSEGAHDWAAERAGYHATHEALEERLHAAGGISLNKARVASPASRLLRIKLGDAFALLLAHDRRHLWQIRQLRADPAFPAA
ncbi:MAG TPA: DinB family protein, partial [Longimicrobium sp.]